MSKTPSVTIKKLTFNDGTIVDLNEDDIIIFVGPNNAGKSRCLKDIEGNIINKSKKGLIVKEIEYNSKNVDDYESLKSYFERNYKKDEYSNYLVPTNQTATHFSDQQLKQCNTYVDEFYRALYTSLSTENRLKMTTKILQRNRSDFDTINLQIMTMLENNNDKINKLNEYISDGYGKGIEIDNIDEAYDSCKMYKIGDDKTIKDIIKMPKREAHAELAKLENLHDQGDGIRSAIAILASLIVNEHSLYLIDEPETFMHPPQARLLGKNIVDLSEGKQCFIATHNIDIIRGILEKNSSRVKILKIDRDGNNNFIKKLDDKDNNSIKKIASDKNLKYTNILNGLFYSCVVLCENETDCKFYSAILEHLDERKFHNTLFCGVGGKGQFKIVINLLKNAGIQYKVIADIDLINSEDELKNLLNSIEEGKYSEIESKHAEFLELFETRYNEQYKSQKMIKKEINDSFTEAKTIPPEVVVKIENILKKINKISMLKTGGRDIIPSGNCIKDFTYICNFLKENNVYILECGEVERLIPEIDQHGNGWVEEVFLNYPDISDDIYNKSREFIKMVFDI